MGYIERKYLVRWRFDFAKKPEKFGMWCNPGENPKDQAWCVNKNGLIRASIEGKDFQTREIKTLAECDGPEFCNFQWESSVTLPALSRGTHKIKGAIIGLSLVTVETKIFVYIDGRIMIKKRSDQEKNTHFAAYGK